MDIKIVGFTCLILVQLCTAAEVIVSNYRLDPQTDPGFFNPGTLRVTRKSRKLLVISGWWEILQNAGEDVRSINSVLHKNVLTGRYEKVWSQNVTACELLNKNRSVLPKIRKVSNFPPAGTCPFPKGRYTIDNYKFELPEAFPLPPGDYIIVERMIKDGHFLLGLEWPITVHY
ncbi:hypothetical protein RP20_CCG028117 [Aedes albopictus]|nr:hypothetical protein RP20_CCG028117 [Aedes albopictus]